MKNLQLLILTFGLGLLLLSCNKQTPETASPTSGVEVANQNTPLGQASVDDDESAKNLLQIAIGSADHSTLVVGVQAAEIEHILVNNGPITLFAPSNAGFDKLPEGVLDDLLKPENKEKLARILTYHAAPGTYKGKLFKNGRPLYMATGDNVEIVKKDGKVFANGSEIVGTIDASNGVVHVINDVLMPPEQ